MSMKTTVLNCPVNLCDIQGALDEVSKALSQNSTFHVVTLNPEMVMYANKNEDFLQILNSCDLNIADGVGIKIALRLKNINQNQIRGVDFARALISLAASSNYKVAFLGAKEEVIQKAKQNFLNKFPNLNFVYVRNGYFEDENEIIQNIINAKPQILLVGLGSPRQEQIISKLKKELQGCTMVGVGGSFDIFSGIVKESPVIFRKLGLEWLYRTISQPQRIKRIFPILPLFLIKCIIDTIKKG